MDRIEKMKELAEEIEKFKNDNRNDLKSLFLQQHITSTNTRMKALLDTFKTVLEECQNTPVHYCNRCVNEAFEKKGIDKWETVTEEPNYWGHKPKKINIQLLKNRLKETGDRLSQIVREAFLKRAMSKQEYESKIPIAIGALKELHKQFQKIEKDCEGVSDTFYDIQLINERFDEVKKHLNEFQYCEEESTCVDEEDYRSFSSTKISDESFSFS